MGVTSGASPCLSPAEARWRPRVPPLWKPRVLGSSLRGSGCGAAAGGGDRDAELPGAGGEDGGRQGPPALPAHRGGRQVSEWRVAGQGPPSLHRPGRDRGRGPASPSRPCSSRVLRRPATLSGDPRPGSQAYSLPRPVRHPPFPCWEFSLLRPKPHGSPSYRSLSVPKLPVTKSGFSLLLGPLPALQPVHIHLPKDWGHTPIAHPVCWNLLLGLASLDTGAASYPTWQAPVAVLSSALILPVGKPPCIG